MTSSATVITTLIGYKLVLLGIGLWAWRRSQDQGEFFLGGRSIGAWVTAISSSASAASAWTLLGVSGFALTQGLPAVWLCAGVILGYVINWFWVGPRLRVIARQTGALTLTELLLGDGDDALRRASRKIASLIILVSFVFYVAAQFQAAGDAFGQALGLPGDASIMLGAVIILAYTLLGGFLAVSVTDTLQGMLMVFVAVALPAVALFALANSPATAQALLSDEGALRLTPANAGIAGLGFIIGCLSVGLAQPGQPHVVNRYMAARSGRAIRQGRIIALAWVVLVLSGMTTLGLAGRVLFTGLGNPETVLFETAASLLPPVLSGLVIAAVLSAIMSTADSQLLAGAAAASRDWRLERVRERKDLKLTYIVVALITIAATLIALFAPEAIFTRVLFAWHALGASFAPLVVMTALRRRVRPAWALAVLVCGFAFTVLLNWQENTPGDWAERLLPLMLTMTIAWFGSRRAPGAVRGGA